MRPRDLQCAITAAAWRCRKSLDFQNGAAKRFQEAPKLFLSCLLGSLGVSRTANLWRRLVGEDYVASGVKAVKGEGISSKLWEEVELFIPGSREAGTRGWSSDLAVEPLLLQPPSKKKKKKVPPVRAWCRSETESDSPGRCMGWSKIVCITITHGA